MRRFLVRVILGIALAASALRGAGAAPTPPPILGAPNTNPQAPQTGPIQVESCALNLVGNELAAKTGTVEIHFTNESPVVADLIRFRFDWAPEATAYVRDVGTFSPGITIVHKFKQSEGAFISPLLSRPKIVCSVESAHFTDGTVWTNPRAGPPVATGTATLDR